MKAQLSSQGWLFKLHSNTTRVGRHEDSDLCLRNAGVEDRHALIEWREGEGLRGEGSYVLTDLNSAHGTYVNGCRVHNASVGLSHADLLHFGYGGPAYQLSLETSTPLPQLPRHQSPAPPVCVWGGATSPTARTPRPPSRSPTPRIRPASAGARRPGSWCGATGSRGSKSSAATQNTHTLQRLLQEKEECVCRLEEEVGRLRVCESECVRKERLISSLRDEVAELTHTQAELTHTLTHAQAQADLTHTLSNLQTDVTLKTQQILELTEQTEQCRLAVTERDLKISTLRSQLDKLKTEHTRNTGLVTSLQHDLSSRDSHTVKLTAEMERLRHDIRHKDAQLHNISNKFSKKQQSESLAHQNEVNTLKKSVESLEVCVSDTHRDLRLTRADRDTLRSTLDRKTQELSGLSVELDKLKQQLSEVQTNTQEQGALASRIGTLMIRPPHGQSLSSESRTITRSSC
ncbi:forkhead-associated domain-containing protein 1 [Engraulis encrasicolus]|uniref:forkhead-associated domain-containing protein 1 n=1 Tax=Engraulis encrasicolus TaxID=184585 RepID=UPI002FD743EC